MAFFDTLTQETSAERQQLLSAPIIEKSLTGDITVEDYVSFLKQAYHHVKHTVPLLMAVGAQLPEQKEWLREAVAEYIEEELGHQEWILNDIAACGFDKEAVRNSTPHYSTELMVAYAYDMVNRCQYGGKGCRQNTLYIITAKKRLFLPLFTRSFGSRSPEIFRNSNE